MITAFYIICAIVTAKSPVSAKSFDLAVMGLTVMCDMFIGVYTCVLYSVLTNQHTENKIKVLEYLKSMNKKQIRKDQDGTGSDHGGGTFGSTGEKR